MSNSNIMLNGIEYAPVIKSAPLDCDGKAIQKGDVVYIRQSAVKEYPSMTGLALDRNFYFAGASVTNPGWLQLERYDGYQMLFPINHVRRGIAATSYMDTDGKSIHVGDQVRIRLSAMGKYSFTSEFARTGTLVQSRLFGNEGCVLVTMKGESSPRSIAMSVLRKGAGPAKPAAPSYADADGKALNIGDSVRIRLSKVPAYVQYHVTKNHRTFTFQGMNAGGWAKLERDGQAFNVKFSEIRRNS